MYAFSPSSPFFSVEIFSSLGILLNQHLINPSDEGSSHTNALNVVLKWRAKGSMEGLYLLVPVANIALDTKDVLSVFGEFSK